MDGPVKSSATLEVSVSFGRFENDGLSWEKWSSFSPNKYLEEAGNLSTPGSVAQKKAYFEAHYKKIAAKKAEEFEQEKLMGPVVPSPDRSKKEDCAANSSESDPEVGLSDGERVVEEVAHEACITLMPNGVVVQEAKTDDARSSKGDEQGDCVNGSIEVIGFEEEKKDAAILVKYGSSAVKETKDDMNGKVEGGDVAIRKDAQSIRAKTLQKGSQHIVEKPRGRKSGLEQSHVSKKENSKLNAQKTAERVTPSKKDRTLIGTTKKVESPAVKQLQTSIPRNSMPATSRTPTSASKTFKKQVNGSQFPKSKNSLVGESKKAAPTSLHMSMNMGSAKSSTAIPTTRKSLIMEKMGDKDIVKRAFKTFQNRANESASDGKFTSVKHMLSASVDLKISASRTPTQGNEGLRKDSEKLATQRSQLGTRSNALTKGSHKNSALDRKNATAFPLATGMRSDEKAEKRKEFLKKLEAKSMAREAGVLQNQRCRLRMEPTDNLH